MKKCWVYSNRDFNKFMEQQGWNSNNIPEDCAFISICDPDYVNVKFNLFHWFPENTANVINLDFYDITDYYIEEENIYGMSDAQAETLYKFIESNIGKDFYIHCAAGVSRSQGVAKYIVDMYNDIYSEESLRKDNPCEFPNLHVVSLLKHIYYDKHK